MRFRAKSVVISLAMLLTGVSSAGAQSSDVNDLNRRMGALEKKVDALIDLLQSQQSTAPAMTSSGEKKTDESQPESSPAGYVPGLFLDVWAPSPDSLKNQEYFDIDGIPTMSIQVSPDNGLNFSSFLSHSEMEGFNDSIVLGVRYNGYILIKKAGRHHFRSDVTFDYRYGSQYCRSSFSINGKKITSSQRHSESPQHAVDESDVSLAPGLYSFSNFTFCGSRGSRVVYKTVETQLLMAEPGDRSVHPIPTDRFFIKADE